MKRKVVSMIVLLAAIAAIPFVSYGGTAYGPDFRATYPDSAAKLQSCNLCHTASIPGLNNYGADFVSYRQGTPQETFRILESLDSDGDGFGNLEEINSGSMPGDVADRPGTSVF